jgi:hypothetical protein
LRRVTVGEAGAVGVQQQRGRFLACAVGGGFAGPAFSKAQEPALLVLPFSFVTFLLGKQKKSKRCA